MAMAEFKANKMRTGLSLFGITIGIFCIISVLATVQSLEKSVQDGLKDMGTNTIFVEKWPWGGSGDFPWWKYMKRPDVDYKELAPIQEKSNYTTAACFSLFTSSNIEYKDDILENVSWYGITEDYNRVQDIVVKDGRYINTSEFFNGSPVIVMGYENAVRLFGDAEKALNKQVTIKNRTVTIIGVLKKYGKSLIGGWDFDNIILVPYYFCNQLVNQRNVGRLLLVKGKDGVSTQNLKDELKGIMRGIRKLQPTEEDNFALNDINAASDQTKVFFSSVKIGGFIIGGFSLIVGLFGIANIMFVTVKERTSQIGLKKAVGAKRRTILTEFLMESSFLCIIGGLIGLFLVWGLATAVSSSGFMPFKIVITPGIVILALTISIIVGLLAGFIPALRASKLDAVVAIRSK